MTMPMPANVTRGNPALAQGNAAPRPVPARRLVRR
jgi:hypothetical protein